MDAHVPDLPRDDPGRPPAPAVRDRAESAVALVIAVAAALAAWQAWRLGLWDGFEPGPGLFPLAASGLCIGLAIASLAASARRPRTTGAAAPAGDGPGASRRVACYAAAIVLWSCSLPWLGFTISGALALGAIMRFAEHRSWRASVPFAIVSVLACRVVFDTLLGVPLPRGVIPGL